jgi:hypothetical protein
MDMQKRMLGSIAATELIYSSDDNENDSWKWKPDGKHTEELNWLINK